MSETNVGWLRAIRGFQRNAIILFISAGILGFAYWGITYLLTNLFIVRLGYGTEVVGNLNALFYLLHMAFSVPAGALGMRIGSRRAMIAGGVLALVGWAVGPTASFLLEPGERMAALASSRVLSSIGGALFIVNANPALMGSVRPEHRTYAFAFNGAVISLTTFLGSICGGFLPPLFAALSGGNLLSSRPYGFSLWTGVLVLAPSLAALFFFRETGKGARGEEEARSMRAPIGLLAVIAIVRLLREIGYGGVLNFFNLYLDSTLHLPTSLIGVLVSISAIASIVFTPLMPVFANRWGTGRTSLIGLLVMGASIIPLAFFVHWAPAALGWAGMTAANSINESAMQVYILQIVAARWRNLMSGAANMSTTLGLAASAMAGGYLIGALGYRTLFLLSAGSLLASGAVFAVHLVFHGRRGVTAAAR